jgi:hypothetical protein
MPFWRNTSWVWNFRSQGPCIVLSLRTHSKGQAFIPWMLVWRGVLNTEERLSQKCRELHEVGN